MKIELSSCLFQEPEMHFFSRCSANKYKFLHFLSVLRFQAKSLRIFVVVLVGRENILFLPEISLFILQPAFCLQARRLLALPHWAEASTSHYKLSFRYNKYYNSMQQKKQKEKHYLERRCLISNDTTSLFHVSLSYSLIQFTVPYLCSPVIIFIMSRQLYYVTLNLY